MDAHPSISRLETPRRNQGDVFRRGRVGAGHRKHQAAHLQLPPSNAGAPGLGSPVLRNPLWVWSHPVGLSLLSRDKCVLGDKRQFVTIRQPRPH